MQRTMQQGTPAQRQQPYVEQGSSEPSPALLMARRIRAEQGIDQLKRFLMAIEPFVAPAEREGIANSMGIHIEPSPPPNQERPQPNMNNGMPFGQGTFNQGEMNPMYLLQNLMGRGNGMGGMGNMGNMGGMGGMGGNAQGLDPMMLAQLMNMMGGTKKQ